MCSLNTDILQNVNEVFFELNLKNILAKSLIWDRVFKRDFKLFSLSLKTEELCLEWMIFTYKVSFFHKIM